MADDSTELRLARAYRDEAEQIKRAAEADLEAARYERGQADHRLRTAESTLRTAEQCKQWLLQHDEARVHAIVTEAEAKLKRAEELVASVDKVKHEAAINLSQLIEHDKRELAAAGIKY
jgi:hypothetical protein